MSSNELSPFFLTKQDERQAGPPQGVLHPCQNGSHLPTQPIIGIPLLVQQGPQGPLLLADAVGIWAIERMGARSLLIPLWPFPPHEQAHHLLWELLPLIDGLFLPARESSHRPFLRQEDKQQPHPWEEALAQLATAVGMPVLALADGACTWNRALGGKVQDEAPPGPPDTPLTAPPNWERRTLRVRAHSTLASALQATLDLRDSEHKPWELPFMSQPNVKLLARGLRSCAQLADGTVVAFERRDAAFGLGMLGRLDWGLEQEYSRAVFAAFLQACQSFDRSRQHQGVGNPLAIPCVLSSLIS